MSRASSTVRQPELDRPGVGPGERSAPPPGRLAEWLAIAAILALALAIRLAYGPHVRDDAYITLRYAQHLTSGQGFTFNAGERVLGTTTPLFALLVAALGLLGVAPTTGAVAIGIAADLGVIYLLWRFGRATVGPAVGLLASLIYALLTPTVAHAVSGMETTFYLLVIVLAFHLAHARRLLPAAATSAVLILTRPDGALVPATLLIWIVWTVARDGGWPPRPRAWMARYRALWGRHWRVSLLFIAPLVPWVAAAFLYFGSPVPQSVLAKWDLQVGGRLGSARYFAGYFLDLHARWFLPLTVLALIGLCAGLGRRRALHPFLLWSGLYAAAFLASGKFVYPAWPFEWYFLPLLLPYALAIAAGWAYLAGRIARWLHQPDARQRRLLVGSVAIFIVPSLVLLSHEHGALDRFVGGRETLYQRLAERMAEYGVSAEAVAAPEIGAFGYAYPGPVLDLYGLISPAAVGRSFDATLREQQPPWLVSYDTILPAELAQSSWFQARYRPVAQLQNWESRRLILYRWYPEAVPTRAAGALLGDALELVGRRLRWEQAAHGCFLRVELTWRARQVPSSRTTLSLQLLDGQDAKLAQQDNEPQEGTRPTTAWRAGELLVDRYDLALPASEAREPARLIIAGYQTENPGEMLSWRSAGGTSLGPQLDVPLPPAEGLAMDEPGVASCAAAFAQGVRLAGIAIQPSSAGDALALVWSAGGTLEKDYTVFVHLLDGAGQVVAQADGPLAGGRLPTSVWEPGDRVLDTHIMPREAAGSIERAFIGLYVPDDGSRLPRVDGPGDGVMVSLEPDIRCER